MAGTTGGASATCVLGHVSYRPRGVVHPPPSARDRGISDRVPMSSTTRDAPSSILSYLARSPVSLCGVLSLFACSSESETPANAIEKAVSIENENEKAAKEIAAKASEEAKKKKAAKDAAQKQREADIDAAAVLPTELPAHLEAACDAVVTAYDTFMKSGAERDALEWSDGRRKKLGARRTACAKVGNLRVAACEAAALSSPPASLAEMTRLEAGRLLMGRCHDKFAGS